MERVMLRMMLNLITFYVLSSKALAADRIPPQASKTRRVNEEDNNDTVELNAGDRLLVSLKGNPTTGYEWVQVKGDSRILKKQGEPKFQVDDGAIGSGGRFTLEYEARAPGKTTLELAYRRPFVEKEPAEASFRIFVLVQET